MVEVLVLYYSRTGRTDVLANAVAEGARSVRGVTATVKRVDCATMYDFISCDAVAFGSPNYFGYMAGLMKTFFDTALSIRDKVTGKPAVAFTSGGSSSDTALKSLENMIASFKLEKAADGVAAQVDRAEKGPKEKDVAACKKLGEALAKATVKRTEAPKD